ncbi:MAG: hypothetical protein K6E91_01910 [Butyrivibrio sp.]|nr:hypothetical protein [Butyrivibrio sp.]
MKYKRLLATVMTAVMVSAMAISTAAAGETDVKDAVVQEAVEAKASEETKAASEVTETDKTQEVKTGASQSASDTASEGAQEVKTEASDSVAEAKAENADAAADTKSEDVKASKTEGTDAAVQEAAESDNASSKATESEAKSQEEAAKAEAQAGKTAEQAGEGNTSTDEHEAKLALQNDPDHVHKFEWIPVMNEFEAADGTNKYMCPECGKVWFLSPMPAYLAFSGSTAYKIRTAPQGGTVKITTSHFISFNKEVMEALKNRPDVSLYVSFLDQEYKGNRVSFTIPAGTDAMSLLDENGYAGFLYIGGKVGLNMEVPMETGVVDDAANDQVKSEQPVEETKKEAETQQKEEAANTAAETPAAENVTTASEEAAVSTSAGTEVVTAEQL